MGQAVEKLSIAERARRKAPAPKSMIDRFIAEQADPESYRTSLLAACADELCTFPSIRDVLVEDGMERISEDVLRKWYVRQPETVQ